MTTSDAIFFDGWRDCSLYWSKFIFHFDVNSPPECYELRKKRKENGDEVSRSIQHLLVPILSDGPTHKYEIPLLEPDCSSNKQNNKLVLALSTIHHELSWRPSSLPR